MPTLVVIGYENEIKAEEVRLALLKLQREYLIDLGDAVVAVREADGKVKLRQLVNTTAAGALGGGFWGTLAGVLFLNPLFGLAVGAAAGALSGALTDVGIDDKFIDGVRDQVTPGTSALFVMTSDAVVDKVEQAFKQHQPSELIFTNLSDQQESALRQVFAA